MIEIKSEPIVVVYEDLSTVDFSLGVANECTSTGGGKPNVDIVHEMPIEGIEFECVSDTKNQKVS